MFELTDNSLTGLNWRSFLSSDDAFSDITRTSGVNKEMFKKVIRQLSQFRNDGKLSDEEFSNLVSFVSSLFVENEVEIRVSSVLSRIPEKISNVLAR